MTRGRTFVFIGAQRRGAIVRQVSESGEWTGRRGPMTMTILRNPIGNIEGQQIEFKYTIYRKSGTGFADSASDAIGKCEQIYNERTPQNVRPPKPSRRRKSNQSAGA